MQKDLAIGWLVGKVQGVWERSRRSQRWSHDFSPGWTQGGRVRVLTERRVLVKNLHSTLNFDKSLLHRTSSLRLKIPPCSHHYYSPQLKYGKTGQQRPSAIPDNPQPAGWGAEPELRLEAQKACHSLLTHPPPNQGVFTAFQVFFSSRSYFSE